MKNKLGCLIILIAVLSVGCSNNSVEDDTNSNIDVVEAEEEIQQNIEEGIEEEIEQEQEEQVEPEVNLTESIEEVEKMLEGDITDDERAKLESELASTYYDRGDYNNGDYEKAIELATQSSERTEDSNIIYNNDVLIGDCYQQSGDFEKAIDKYTEAQQLDVNSELVKYNEAYVLTQKSRTYTELDMLDEAKENIEEVIYITDVTRATAMDKVHGYMLLAGIYYDYGDMESASKACEDGYMFAIKAEQYDAAVGMFMLRAMLHEELGEYDKAYDIVSDAIIFCNEVLSLGFDEVMYEHSLMLEEYKTYLDTLR